MTEVQKNIPIWMLVAGFAFLGGVLLCTWTEDQRLSQPPQELAVAGTALVRLQDMVEARATIYLDPKDPAYPCVREAARDVAAQIFAEYALHRPSRVREAMRNMTRMNCGQPVSVLIDVPKTELSEEK